MSRNRHTSKLRKLFQSDSTSKVRQNSSRRKQTLESNLNYESLEARQLLAVDFSAVNFTSTHNFSAPSQNSIGVGPIHVVSVQNNEFRVYDKLTGAVVTSKSLANFWTDGVGSGGGARSSMEMVGNITDPSVLYDAQSRRWFLTSVSSADVITGTPGTQNPILLAVSSTSNPSLSWQSVSHRFDVDANPITPDVTYNGGFIPLSLTGARGANLSVDADNVYVVADDADPMTPDQLWVFNKFADLVKPGPRVPAMGPVFPLPDPTVEIAVDVSGTALGTYGLTTNTDGTILQLFEITNRNDPAAINLSAPIDIPLVVPFEAPPINVRQQFDPDLRNSGSSLLASVGRQGDSIWAAHAVLGSAGTSAIRWYEIDVLTMSIKQFGTIEDPIINFIYPSIAVTVEGHVAIAHTTTGFSNLSNQGQFPSASVSVGFDNNGVMTFEAPYVVKSGEGGYLDDVGNFWTESSIAIDPSSSDKVWMMAPWSTVTGEGRVQITEVVLLGLSPEITGDITDDVFIVRRSAVDVTQIEIEINGTVTESFPELATSSISIDGGGGLDTFLIDTSNGAFTFPNGVIFVGDGDDIVGLVSDLDASWTIDGDGSGTLVADTITGSFTGMAEVNGGAASDSFQILVTDSDIVVRGQGGNDNFTIDHSGVGIATLEGNADDDLFDVVNSGDAGMMVPGRPPIGGLILNGGDGQDEFNFNNLLGTADVVALGGGGNDLFNVNQAGSGLLQLRGELGDDSYIVTTVADTVDFRVEDSLNLENDRFEELGTPNDDVFLIGSTSRWSIVGIEIYEYDGLEGDDTFDVTLDETFAGQVLLTGGLGNDQFLVNQVGAGNLQLFGDEGDDYYQIQFSAGMQMTIDDFDGIDRLLALGTAGNDILNLTAGAGNFASGSFSTLGIDEAEFRGLDGNDTFNLNGPIGKTTVFGGRGNDIFNIAMATDGNSYYGDDGDDRFNIGSASGISFYRGGNGRDVFEVTNRLPLGTIGSLDIDGGADANQLIVNGYETSANFAFVSSNYISGMSGVPISFRATGGSFSATNNGLQGVTLRGSNSMTDQFDVQSFSSNNTLLMQGRGGDDVFKTKPTVQGSIYADGGEGSDFYRFETGTGQNQNLFALDTGVVGTDRLITFFTNNADDVSIGVRSIVVSTDRITFNSNLEVVRVDTLAGNDRVFVGVSDIKFLLLKTGDGNDTINVGNFFNVSSGILLDGGAGDDLFNFTNTIHGSLATAIGGLGNDVFSAASNAFGNLVLDGQSGSDHYLVSLVDGSNRFVSIRESGGGHPDVDRVQIDGSSRAETVTLRVNAVRSGNQSIIYNPRIETLVLNTGAGADIVNVYGISAQTTNINTQGDQDFLALYSTFGGTGQDLVLNVDLGDQNDIAVVRGLNADTRATILGGTGDDYFSLGSSQAENNGSLKSVAGQLTLLGNEGIDRIYLNDVGSNVGKNYRVNLGSLTQVTGQNTVVPGRLNFASVENLRLDTNSSANRVDVIPSTNIRYQFVGRGGNDTIHLNDLDPRVDVRVLTKTASRSGFWRFSNGNRDVVFENFGVI